MISVLVPILGSIVTAILTERAPDEENNEGFGAVPPPPASMASGASVLQSAALATPGSWTQRNVLQAGAQSAYARRLAGTASEADFAVLRAARPGIASSQSGPISPGWSKSPWQPEGGLFKEYLNDEGLDNIADAVAEEFGVSGKTRLLEDDNEYARPHVTY